MRNDIKRLKFIPSTSLLDPDGQRCFQTALDLFRKKYAHVQGFSEKFDEFWTGVHHGMVNYVRLCFEPGSLSPSACLTPLVIGPSASPMNIPSVVSPTIPSKVE